MPEGSDASHDQHHLGRERLGDVAGPGSAGTRRRPRRRYPRRRPPGARDRGADRKGRSWTRPGSYLDRAATPRRLLSCHACAATMPPLRNPSSRPVKPDRPAPDPLRHGSIALLAVLEGLPDATVGANRDGTIVFVNELAEKQFGYTREELIGQPIEILWPERVRDRYRANLELYFELEHPLRFSERAYGRRKDGTEFIGEMSWGIVASDDGPAAARDRPQHLRAARVRGAAAPPVRAAGRGRRAGRAGAARRRAGRAEQGGRRARPRDARRRARRGARRAAGDRRLGRARGARPARSASRSTPATASTARSWPRPRTRTRSARRRARSCRRSPTCSRSRSRACTSRSRCATRRCTTR